MSEGDSRVAPTPTTSGEIRRSRQHRRWPFILFVLPIAAVIVPALYSRIAPRLGGVPFFVWYQFAAVIFGGVVTGIVYVLGGTERKLTKVDDRKTGQK